MTDTAPAASEAAPQIATAPDAVAAQPDTQQAAHNDAPAPDLESLARDMGWRPKEDWKGDDSGWRDAATFVKQTVDVNRSLKKEMSEVKDTLKNLGSVNEKILQKELAKQRRSLEAEFGRAVDENNPAEARRISAELEALNRPAPAADYRSRFKTDNPWFESNREATAYAVAMAGEAGSDGKPPEEQLKYAAEMVRKRFPELFETEASRRQAPTVQGGQRTTPERKKTYPAEVMKAAQDAVSRKRADSVAEYLAMYDKETA